MSKQCRNLQRTSKKFTKFALQATNPLFQRPLVRDDVRTALICISCFSQTYGHLGIVGSDQIFYLQREALSSCG